MGVPIGAEALHLGQLVIGDQAQVMGFDKSNCRYRQRLLTMGLTPGAMLTVTRVAPLGDPIEIRVRGFCLCLRNAEAATIRVCRQRL